MGLTYEEAVRAGIGHLHPDAPGGATAPVPREKGPKAGRAAPAPSVSWLAPAVAGGPTRWTVELPGWTPPSLNALLGGHWTRKARIKAGVKDLIAGALLEAGVPRAVGRRRVAVAVTVRHPRHRPDPDNVWKALLDALTLAGALVDDSPEWCCLVPVESSVGPAKGTVIVIEDVGDHGEPPPGGRSR